MENRRVNALFQSLLGSHGCVTGGLLFGPSIRRMSNISGTETAHPRRALDNLENYSAFIFPHVHTRKTETEDVFDRSDAQMYDPLLSMESSLCS